MGFGQKVSRYAKSTLQKYRRFRIRKGSLLGEPIPDVSQTFVTPQPLSRVGNSPGKYSPPSTIRFGWVVVPRGGQHVGHRGRKLPTNWANLPDRPKSSHTLFSMFTFLSDLSILPLSRGMDSIRWGRHPILAEDWGTWPSEFPSGSKSLGTSGKADASEEWRTISLVGK